MIFDKSNLVELLEFYGIYKSSPCEIANRKTVDLDLHTNRFNSKYSKKTKLSSEFATDDVSISAYGKTFNDEWYDMSLRDINRLVELKNKIEDNELRLALK